FDVEADSRSYIKKTGSLNARILALSTDLASRISRGVQAGMYRGGARVGGPATAIAYTTVEGGSPDLILASFNLLGGNAGVIPEVSEVNIGQAKVLGNVSLIQRYASTHA